MTPTTQDSENTTKNQMMVFAERLEKMREQGVHPADEKDALDFLKDSTIDNVIYQNGVMAIEGHRKDGKYFLTLQLVDASLTFEK